MYNDKVNDARLSLKWLRGKKFNTEEEIKEIIDFQNSQQKQGAMVLFSDALNRRALIISFGLIAGFQLSGINYVMFYTASIFEVSQNFVFVHNYSFSSP